MEKSTASRVRTAKTLHDAEKAALIIDPYTLKLFMIQYVEIETPWNIS